jgi:imidazoleglycerol phosphate dehydratase HisB
LNLDGTGKSKIETGIALFLIICLTIASRANGLGNFGKGDLGTMNIHTIEDTIALETRAAVP